MTRLYDRLFVKPYVWLSNFLAWVIDWRFWHDWFHDRVIANASKITDFLANPIDWARHRRRGEWHWPPGALGLGGLRQIQRATSASTRLCWRRVLVVASFTLIVMLDGKNRCAAALS